ncbi:ABC-three component system middle component 1 [Paenibacillus sp. NPDC058174]|uniref:ABC-three component system middle component 1 n=1 Tax=Paenibacillus sp. NPDC058174 TaxID=3346366 RepID=UPI0036DDA0EA
MRLGDLVEQLGYGTDIEHELFTFQLDLFKVYKMKRKEDFVKGDVISEYIFVEVSNSALKKLISDTDMKYFHDFQAKLLSEQFFSHKSDLRWNLYLIIIVESYDQFSDTGILQMIENNADYARKFVMTAKDALQWLDKSWLKSSSNEENVYIDPMQEWQDELIKAELTGCLTETFAQRNVQNYLDGHVILAPNNIISPRRTRQDLEYDEVIGQIGVVSLNGFRAHCFDSLEPLYPSQVNLLHGPNGSGKTSVMEAIELALTNEINRCSEFGDDIIDSFESLRVSCITDSSNTIHFQPGKPNSFYKMLAQKWYGLPAGRQSSELNSLYHRYNFFDSEAAYRFALNESSQVEKGKFDYSDNLSRLVFGNDVIEAQKNWTRYLQEFVTRSDDLAKQQKKIFAQLEALRQDLSNSSQNDDVQLDQLDRHLNDVFLKSPRKNRAANESTSDYLLRLSFLFQSVEAHREQIGNYRLNVDILSLNQIEMQHKELQENLNEFLQKKRNMESAIAKWEAEKTAFDQQLHQNETQLINTNLAYDNIKQVQEQWEKIKKTIEQPDQVEVRKNLDMREEEISKIVEWIDQLNSKHYFLNNLTENDIAILSPEDHTALLIRIKEKEVALSNLKEQLFTTERLAGKIEAMLSRIHTTGEEFLLNHENSTFCPLCAQDYGSHQALVDALLLAKTITSDNGEQLAELYEKIRLLENEIKEASEQHLLHEKNMRNITLINKAYTELSLSHFFRNRNLDIPLIEKLNEFRMFIATKSEFIIELSQVQGQIRVFDDFGMSRHYILQGEHFRQENTLYKEFKVNDHRNSFEEFLMEREGSLFHQLSQARKTKAKLEEQRHALIELIKQQSFDSVEASIEHFEQKILYITKIFENVKLLLDDFDLGSDVNLLAWSTQLQKVQVYIELLVKNQERLKDQARLQAELDEKVNTLLTIENQLKKCTEACTALGKLKPLRDYTEGFIVRNISLIERFFNVLHTPREFDQLELGESGLSLRRKWDEKPVKAYQMSSGQRASLALSVMFAIHLAAPRAPRVLMMDEPVANMDDLHLMNLLDLLRDLSLSGRQIFFTTANPDVANLFRRKFSFYGERFTHFEFMRSSGEPVQIQPIHYSPNIEPPAIKQVKQR